MGCYEIRIENATIYVNVEAETAEDAVDDIKYYLYKYAAVYIDSDLGDRICVDDVDQNISVTGEWLDSDVGGEFKCLIKDCHLHKDEPSS